MTDVFSPTYTFPSGIPPGPFPGTCAHMAYLPKSPMAFPGDLHHDFRDFQNDGRVGIIADWVGLAAKIYLDAAHLLGMAQDPIADCLAADSYFDTRTVWAAHDHMAMHWRAHWLERAFAGTHLKVEPGLFRCVPIYTYRDLQNAFGRWLMDETRSWARKNPARLRLMCRAVVGEHSQRGRADEMAFLYGLICEYRLPGRQ